MPGSLIQGNALCVPLKDKSVQLCCFSPPYFGSRKYKISDIEFPDGWKGQMGLEPTIDQFLNNLMLVMKEVWRVLRDDGVCFVNIGDNYAGSPSGSPIYKNWKTGGIKNATTSYIPKSKNYQNTKPKSLCLIPQKFAIRCQEAGWIVRSEIIFHKLNPMPESCKDRPTKAHEQVWMLTKQGRYFWDQEAVRESHSKSTIKMSQYPDSWRTENKRKDENHSNYMKKAISNPAGRNLRSVWTMATEPHPECHFATWPSKLVGIMIKAGSSPKACEICGAPWTKILEKTFVPQEDVSLERGIRCCPGQKSLDKTDNRAGFPRGNNQTRTVGWRKTCECKVISCSSCSYVLPLDNIKLIKEIKDAIQKQGRTQQVQTGVGQKEILGRSKVQRKTKKEGKDTQGNMRKLRERVPGKSGRKILQSNLCSKENVGNRVSKQIPEGIQSTVSVSKRLQTAQLQGLERSKRIQINISSKSSECTEKRIYMRTPTCDGGPPGKAAAAPRDSSSQKRNKKRQQNRKLRADEQNNSQPLFESDLSSLRKGLCPSCGKIIKIESTRGTGRCVVLDPFVGVGTTVVVAEKNGRFGVGMDLSLDYLVDIALKKIRVPIQKMLELRF